MYQKIFKKQDMIKLQELLKQNNKTITTAESCTGGLIASMITEIPGSSSIFRGSVVTYCNEIKEQELNVRKETMIKFGVVSCEVVEEMCLGVEKKFDADYSIAVSGVAGPTGGTKNKPVGTVSIAISSRNSEVISEIFIFEGDRRAIQIQASLMSLKLLLKILLKNLDK
ncbi:MAG: CinA family protein [Campylobacterota bacterium]|nr:CinA family protein [Campylobacterota bacterium]